ncbi:MAG: SUMF1/EgtB/PvdO family nonheme iron enzyme [Marinilabiliaceae bacterium]|nr:SUMF1/EgtB/PvdO family nonheme iron enzyme [Marinilabiliaceae bacterium]
MIRLLSQWKRRKTFLVFLSGIVLTIFLIYPFNAAVTFTSSDAYCNSCHVHDHAEQSWRLSAHVNNKSGVVVHCVECHLPPKGHGHLSAKAKHGAKDLYGYLLKDSADFKWESKRTSEKANHFTYETSCLKCHSNLYPATITAKGADSHLYYERQGEDMTCLNCHMHTGHYNAGYQHAQNTSFGEDQNGTKEIFTDPTPITAFQNFTEKIPGTSVSFNMVAINGGEFIMGSPDDEPFRKGDEGPQRKVRLTPFFMAEVEVTWDEFLAWFNATASEGRKEAEVKVVDAEVDAITGATPPWGAPDQGWGKGQRPAITMSFHAATQYCKWLSKVTGKKYRLPTESEWEYAARGGQSGPYYFEGNPRDYSKLTTWNKLFGADTAIIGRHVIYNALSEGKTHEAGGVLANPFGLKNMHGNVAEFCSDWYAPNAYGAHKEEVLIDPKGPAKGREHVVRGGSFRSDASDVRSAARDYTQTREWLKTDPQIPKSIWWYSDVNHVGFRVVCEQPETKNNQEQ